VKTIGLPVKFSKTPGEVRTGAPAYGEHTGEVLREHGFDDKQIEAFEREGAIFAASIAGRAGRAIRRGFSTRFRRLRHPAQHRDRGHLP
jgi:hypothetical protein